MISHDINCFDDVCIANKENAYVDKVYVLQKNEKLIFLQGSWHAGYGKTEVLCFEKSKKLSQIIKVFWNSGFNYLFNYSTAKSK